MELEILKPDPKYPKAKLIEPTKLGYIHLAAEVRPRSIPPQRLPFESQRYEKSGLLGRLKCLAYHLEQLDAVERAKVFEATAIAPPSSYVRECKGQVRIARFDVAVLVETTSPEAAREVQTTDEYTALLHTLKDEAIHVHTIAARNAKRIADVDKSRQGLFLFNYFVANDAEVALELWDYLSGWYEAETGMDNSTLLVPLEGESSDYVAINNARWDVGLARFLLRQMPKKSFHDYVLANLDANGVGAMPIIYRLV